MRSLLEIVMCVLLISKAFRKSARTKQMAGGSGASSAAVLIAEEELASIHQFIENALDLKLKVRSRLYHHSLSLLCVTA